jgi:site-specific recombinase XerC
MGAWTKMLKELVEILPCALCKDHMRKYCMTHPITGVAVLGSKGVDIKKAIIQWVYQFHNFVNHDKGVAKFDKAQLQVFYGYGTRVELVADINRTILELDKIWSQVPMRHWKESVHHLLNLVASGPLG